MDEAGLERAATECAPGDVGWDDNVGRFKALVKQLRLGGETTLHGQPLPNPQKEGFDAAVETMFHAASEQSAQLPLVPARDAEAAALGTAAGSPPLQLQLQHRAPAPAPPAPQGSTVGEAPEAAAAGEATGAPRPMEVEAPPLLVPPSVLHGLDHTQLVVELGRVLTAAPLDEAMVGHVLDRLEGLRLSGQEMQNSGVPPAAAHVPSAPAHLHHQPACPNAMPLAALPPTPPSRGPAQARASWSTGCARSQERLRRSQRALASSTRSGRRTGVPTEPQLSVHGVCGV